MDVVGTIDPIEQGRRGASRASRTHGRGRTGFERRFLRDVDDLEALAIVRSRGIQVARLRRAVPEALRDCLADPASLGFVDHHETLDLGDSAACDRALAALDSHHWQPALRLELLELARVFARIARRSSVHVTVETLYGESCRKWHTDRVGLRMLATFLGPGTWLADPVGVDRTWLGSVEHGLEETNRRIVSDPDCVVEAGTGDVLLCKGDLFGSEKGNGVVHRSPPSEGAGFRRLLLRIDERGCGG